MASSFEHNDLRIRASVIAFCVGIIVLLLKFYAYRLSNSTAILSDALESVVNVVAAAFTIYAVRAAQAPPDAEHPYGHGKFEFVTAVFEGGLITFAAFMIAYEAVITIIYQRYGTHLEHALWVVAIAGAMNGALGLYLVLAGKKTRSLALTADGKHVLSDFYTSVGVILALFIVKATGLEWLDPAVALLMAVILAATGIPLVKQAVGGLVDAADPALLAQLLAAFERNREPGIIRAHLMRAMRNGRHIHVDGHIVVPEFWSVEKAHDTIEAFEKRLLASAFPDGEIEFHIDPCRRSYCAHCDLMDCPIRKMAFRERPPLEIKEITSPVDSLLLYKT